MRLSKKVIGGRREREVNVMCKSMCASVYLYRGNAVRIIGTRVLLRIISGSSQRVLVI